MSSRIWLNLALLIVVVALGAIALFSGRDAPTELPRLLALDPATVDTIRIERAVQETVELQRRGMEWRLVQPTKMPASTFRARRLLGLARARSHASYPLADVDPLNLGLTEPQVELYLDERRLAFGDRTALGDRRYVLIDDTVHLMDDTFFFHLVGHWTTFVAPELLPSGDIAAIRMPDLVIRRSGAGWQAEPAPDGMSADAPGALATRWERARAVTVELPDEHQREHLEGPGIEIELQGGETVRFVVLAATPEPLLYRPDFGLVYRLPETGHTLFELTDPEEIHQDTHDHAGTTGG